MSINYIRHKYLKLSALSATAPTFTDFKSDAQINSTKLIKFSSNENLYGFSADELKHF